MFPKSQTRKTRACLWHTPYTQIKKPPPNGRVCGASHHAFGGWNGLCRLRRLKKKSPSERKVSDGLYFQNQKPEKRVRACGTHPTHESKNHRTTVGCVAQATHAFGGWNGLCRLRWLNADSVRDVRDACVRLRRLWAACVPTALHSKRHPT